VRQLYLTRFMEAHMRAAQAQVYAQLRDSRQLNSRLEQRAAHPDVSLPLPAPAN
jgi:hypothetical protein